MVNYYEVINATDEDMYFPMGMFSSKEAAISAIMEAAEPDAAVTDNPDDFEIIKILERHEGWSDNGVLVFTLEREGAYSTEDEDIFIWSNKIKP